DLLAERRHRLQQPANGAQLVVDDVPQRPGTAWPGIRKVDLSLIVNQAFLAGPELAGRNGHRRRYPHVCGLSEQADGIVTERCGVFVPWPVVVVKSARHDA